MKNWLDTKACASRAHCTACRLSPEFRASIQKRYEFDGICLHGVTLENLPLPSARTVSYKIDPVTGKRCTTCKSVTSQTRSA